MSGCDQPGLMPVETALARLLAQAEAAADWLCGQIAGPVRLVCSPLLRARQTASVVQQTLGLGEPEQLEALVPEGDPLRAEQALSLILREQAEELVVVSHAEDGGLAGEAAATAGEMATRFGLPSALAEAEALAVARDIALADLAGARLHFRQVTTAAGFALVRAAKARGLPITCGITPAHFMLSDLATADYRTFARMDPPLRAEDDRQALIEALHGCSASARELSNQIGRHLFAHVARDRTVWQ